MTRLFEKLSEKRQEALVEELAGLVKEETKSTEPCYVEAVGAGLACWRVTETEAVGYRRNGSVFKLDQNLVGLDGLRRYRKQYTENQAIRSFQYPLFLIPSPDADTRDSVAYYQVDSGEGSVKRVLADGSVTLDPTRRFLDYLGGQWTKVEAVTEGAAKARVKVPKAVMPEARFLFYGSNDGCGFWRFDTQKKELQFFSSTGGIETRGKLRPADPLYWLILDKSPINDEMAAEKLKYPVYGWDEGMPHLAFFRVDGPSELAKGWMEKRETITDKPIDWESCRRINAFLQDCQVTFCTRAEAQARVEPRKDVPREIVPFESWHDVGKFLGSTPCKSVRCETPEGRGILAMTDRGMGFIPDYVETINRMMIEDPKTGLMRQAGIIKEPSRDPVLDL